MLRKSCEYNLFVNNKDVIFFPRNESQKPEVVSESVEELNLTHEHLQTIQDDCHIVSMTLYWNVLSCEYVPL